MPIGAHLGCRGKPLYTHIHAYTRIYAHIRIYTHIHACARIYTHIHAYTRIYTHTHIYTHIQAYTHIHAYARIHAYTLMYSTCIYTPILVFITSQFQVLNSRRAYMYAYLHFTQSCLIRVHICERRHRPCSPLVVCERIWSGPLVV